MSNLYEPRVHHRRSSRFGGYDYSLAGAYFITICVQGKKCLLGEVVAGEVVLNSAGKVVKRKLDGLDERFPYIEIDSYVIMPNHVHVVLVLHDQPMVEEAPTVPKITRLGDIVGALKSLSTVEYTKGVAAEGWPPYSGKLWQRNYYERVIRNERELNAIREYIAYNPANWRQDEEHPNSVE